MKHNTYAISTNSANSTSAHETLWSNCNLHVFNTMWMGTIIIFCKCWNAQRYLTSVLNFDEITLCNVLSGFVHNKTGCILVIPVGVWSQQT